MNYELDTTVMQPVMKEQLATAQKQIKNGKMYHNSGRE